MRRLSSKILVSFTLIGLGISSAFAACTNSKTLTWDQFKQQKNAWDLCPGGAFQVTDIPKTNDGTATINFIYKKGNGVTGSQVSIMPSASIVGGTATSTGNSCSVGQEQPEGWKCAYAALRGFTSGAEPQTNTINYINGYDQHITISTTYTSE